MYRTKLLSSHRGLWNSSSLFSTVVGPTISRSSFHASARDAVIVSAVRTPIGSVLSTLSDVTGPQLATVAIKGALSKAGIQPDQVEEVYMGNVIAAGQGQHPARQASLGAGIPTSVPCTNINKVCSSGMKAIMIGASSIMLGHQDIIVAGGFESMSNIPYYVLGARKGLKFGHSSLQDGLILDGLWDVYNQVHMGMAGEETAIKQGISREQQDEYTEMTYRRAQKAIEEGRYTDQIVGVPVPQKKGDTITITEDEEPKKVDFDKMKKLKSAFKKDGSITAANSSKLNDGASAVVLMSGAKAKELGLKPLARIRGFADAECAPLDFTIAPSVAIPKALSRAGVEQSKVDFFEINEAFAVVALANMKLLGIPKEKINVDGGAVALGHPIGCSGARIVTALAHILRQREGKIGVASICNGGGGASAIVIERL